MKKRNKTFRGFVVASLIFSVMGQYSVLAEAKPSAED